MVEINIEETAQLIADELMYEYDYINRKTIKTDRVDSDQLEKDCYYAVAEIKGDIFDKVLEILEKEDIKVD